MERFRDNFLSKPNTGMERFRDSGMEWFHSIPPHPKNEHTLSYATGCMPLSFGLFGYSSWFMGIHAFVLSFPRLFLSAELYPRDPVADQADPEPLRRLCRLEMAEVRGSGVV
jgi:hypothetical protein